MMLLASLLKRYKKAQDGTFAIMASVCMLAVVMIIAATFDITQLSSLRLKAQDNADTAALAAARVMTMSSSTKMSKADRKAEATKAATDVLSTYLKSPKHNGGEVLVNYVNNDKAVEVRLKMKATPYLVQVMGIDELEYGAVSVVNIGNQVETDVDVVLISDATGSMANTLAAIQNNMKGFSNDLEKTMKDRGIKIGNIRIKFVFYRDYAIDNHWAWTGPDMTLRSGLEGWGPMYVSDFYDLPSEKNAMDKYVDYFIANGGGSVRESGLEAVWEALKAADWKEGSTTVRAVVLWTDAPTRPFGDKEEVVLQYGTDRGWDYWLTRNVGFWIHWISKSRKEQYMYDKWYPKDAPKRTSELKSIYETFHNENANGFPGIKTMTINVFDDCSGVSPCGEWPDLAKWDGVDYYYNQSSDSVSETYDKILKQVADTVENQAGTKDIKILN